MVGIPETCRLCGSIKNPTVALPEYLARANLSILITQAEDDVQCNRICHSCIFDVTLLEDLIKKYKSLLQIPIDKCYLCRKENIHFRVTGELYTTIRVIEESFTAKNICLDNFDNDDWEEFKSCLNKRKICNECYFLLHSAMDLFNRVKEMDVDIKRTILRVQNMNLYETSDSDDDDSSDDFGYEEEESVSEGVGNLDDVGIIDDNINQDDGIESNNVEDNQSEIDTESNDDSELEYKFSSSDSDIKRDTKRFKSRGNEERDDDSELSTLSEPESILG